LLRAIEQLIITAQQKGRIIQVNNFLYPVQPNEYGHPRRVHRIHAENSDTLEAKREYGVYSSKTP
jgi:hypothetical protein